MVKEKISIGFIHKTIAELKIKEKDFKDCRERWN